MAKVCSDRLPSDPTPGTMATTTRLLATERARWNRTICPTATTKASVLSPPDTPDRHTSNTSRTSSHREGPTLGGKGRLLRVWTNVALQPAP